MIRFDAIKRVMNAVKHEVVVCNIGHPAQELFAIRDRPENFYMLGSMGLASSIGLGMAMSTTRKIVVIEGDGAMLMNLGSLATIGARAARNYILIIVDNAAYGSTGFQPTFTAQGANLAAMAKACGIENCQEITEEAQITGAVTSALRSDTGPHCLVIRVQPGMPQGIPVIPLEPLIIRKRVASALK